MKRRVVLGLIVILTASSLILVESASAQLETVPLNFNTMAVAPTPYVSSQNTQKFTYVLPNYIVPYAIVEMPPPDRLSIHPSAYNIVVYGPPPFPIQISFYQQNAENTTEKASAIMPTNAYSISIGCTSYPTQIAMAQVDNEYVSPSAQSIPKPSIPEFTLNIVSHPYDVPTTYSTSTPNPYSGRTETIITQLGHHVENRSIEVTIRNQPFTSTLDASGNYTSLYYNFKLKGHYANEWNYWPPIGSGQAHSEASESSYTVINFTLGVGGFFWDIPASGGELDFQVQAMIGHDNKYGYEAYQGCYYTAYSYLFTGETSDWSSTQTIRINENTADTTPVTSSSPSPSLTPQNRTDFSAQSSTQNAVVFGLDWVQLTVLITLIITVIVLAIAVAYLYHKSAETNVESVAGASR